MNPTDQLIADAERYLTLSPEYVAPYAKETIRRFIARVLELDSWKDQQIAVEAEWDAQAVGRLLNVPLGWPIRASIQPSIEALQARIRELGAERAGLRAACEKFLWHFEDLDEMLDPKLADDAKLVIGLMRAALAGPIQPPTEATR